MPDDRAALGDALEAGTELVGHVGGTAVGMVVGGMVAGPPGAIVGAGAGWTTERLIAAGAEITRRMLSPRSTVRVGALFRLVDGEISARIMNGEIPREDFREEVGPRRSPAEELAEAALIAASEMYEERKLPFLAHLLAAIVFEPDLTHSHANQLIATANTLSYRQLLLLSVFAAREPHTGQVEFVGPGSDDGDHHPEFEQPEVNSVRADMLDLFRRGLLRVSRFRTRGAEFGELADYPPWPAIPIEMSPSATWASASGKRLARMMRLDLTAPEDIQALVLDHIWRDLSRDRG